MEEQLRLQVFISRSGFCSRRAAMDLVKEGKVTVNGHVQKEPSFSVSPQKDKICVKGKTLELPQYEYVLFNKPRGYVTTKANFLGQKSIYKILPKKYHGLSPVGRLDKDTEGLLFLTNDGELAFALTHPKFHVDKTYFVIIKGRLSNSKKNELEQGVVIEGGKTAPAKIKDVKEKNNDTSLLITIHEGKKRQIRLMFDSVGHKVKRLKRLIQGPLILGDLEEGTTRQLTPDELKVLMPLKQKVKQ